MTKPMYCPLSFNREARFENQHKIHSPVECTPDCAWAVKEKDYYFCAQAIGAIGCGRKLNIRPLEDDKE